MRLHIIRHGDAVSGAVDVKRSLSPLGEYQVKSLIPQIDLAATIKVWCSSATRTVETNAILQEAFGYTDITVDMQLYLCGLDEFLHRFSSADDMEELLIIGHNFGISDLASYLMDEPIGMQTAEYICIDFGALSIFEVSRGTGTIVHRVYPPSALP